ncbi:MAG: hypothetical protein MJ165_00560 [Alphaproteobacteria bacterium]|nr:hypothetical protein [Alphaproteobacteria bacterium]
MTLIQQYFQYHFAPTYIVAHAPYVMVFKTTHYCWYKCPHCCEDAGPHQDKIYIPENIIYDYLDQALNDNRFSNDIIFTGGEPFSAYRFYDTKYIPNILRYSLNHNIGTDIKTNAGWANTSFGKNIFHDLKNTIIDTHDKKSQLPKLQISLSLDNYHTNCFENNLKIIKELAGLPVIIHLSSIQGQEEFVKHFETALAKQLHPQNACIMDSHGNIKENIKLIKDHTIYIQSYGTLFNGGRAVKIKEAKQTPLPQFSFITQEGFLLVAFDTFGRVTLGENSGHKIATPWIDTNIQPKKLKTISKELVIDALKENLYYNFYEHFFNHL